LLSDNRATYLISLLSVWAAICCGWYWEGIVDKKYGILWRPKKDEEATNNDQRGKIFNISFAVSVNDL
jgi:hypothetical protein